MRNLLKSPKALGTLLISRSELRGLSPEQWETLFIVAGSGTAVRTVVYGKEAGGKGADDARIEELQSAGRDFVETSEEAESAIRYALPNRTAVYLAKMKIAAGWILHLPPERLKKVRFLQLGRACLVLARPSWETGRK